MFKQEKCKQNQPERKRGRPSGKNRTPLSLEERRARNAQYERERRNETAEAMMQLAEAVGCSPNESNEQILRMAAEMIGHQNQQDYDLGVMRRINDCLSAQIAKLEKDLNEKREGASHREDKAGKPQKRKIEKEPALSSSQDPRHYKQKKMKTESGLPTNGATSNTQPLESVQPVSCPLPMEPFAVVPQPELRPFYVPPAENAWQFQSEFSWSLPDPMTMTEAPMMSPEQQTSSGSESERSSSVDLEDILESLSDEEKTLIWGVVQQIDTNAVS